MSGPCFDNVAHGLLAAAWLYGFGPGPALLATHTADVLPPQAGPLMLLKQAYEARAAVRIVTRHARGVRGVATGATAHVAPHTTTMTAELMAKLTRPVKPTGHFQCWPERVGGIVQGHSSASTST